MTKIWVIFWVGLNMSTWEGGIQHGSYIRVETTIWVMIEGFDDHIQQVECHNVDHIPRACLKLPPLAWSNGSRRVQEKPIKSDCIVCLRFRRCTWIAFPQRCKFHHCRPRAHTGDSLYTMSTKLSSTLGTIYGSLFEMNCHLEVDMIYFLNFFLFEVLSVHSHFHQHALLWAIFHIYLDKWIDRFNCLIWWVSTVLAWLVRRKISHFVRCRNM